MVVDAGGGIALIGVSLPQEDLTFCDRARRQAADGPAHLMAEIPVNGNAMNPEIERIPVVIGGKP